MSYRPVRDIPRLRAGYRFGMAVFAQGAHPRAIQERLGHSSVTVAMDIDGHLLPSLDDALTDRLGEAIELAVDGDEKRLGWYSRRISGPANVAGAPRLWPAGCARAPRLCRAGRG